MKFYTIILLALISCGEKKDKNMVLKSKQYNSDKITKTQDSISLKDITLLKKQEAILKYGNLVSSNQFVLDDAQGEFRNNITYSYSEEERLSESVIIDELTWEKDSLNFITLWYEGEKLKSYLIWGKGFEF
ncbi:hypothetical protein [Tenacibaculum maritimum]|uniref:Uncharacterized protein n=2 Tax=Tenacibaculum maritimum TaxID=107401 RepID=A0A2H1E885_9FLAO|nr:hypothetical protein [Tenacibaculum maritimum]MCD9564037.1 hypothetical protein [Tenacibaculum maritimum]MCD9564386.1 hypothetical protein [Tenacibaculum maritimum]MCD9578262.1 hypothetical protein [Tenacibaculum maritimum]MCD9582099.1 hypothetical protein [Tenacibaculum maritimum]MCD9584488.1 hypothetical protein [Tenacibaculum maritimum]